MCSITKGAWPSGDHNGLFNDQRKTARALDEFVVNTSSHKEAVRHGGIN